MRRRWVWLSLAIGSIACGGDRDPEVDAGRDSGAPVIDAGSDAGRADAGVDAQVVDAGGDEDAGSDAGVSDCVGPPGLYADDGTCSVLADGVRAFQPRFPLWSDGDDKERFVYLPPGTQIDTGDPDRWGFPVGTRVYKTFSIGGRRIETRLLEKIAPERGTDSWRMIAYRWSEDQRSVTEASAFGERDVLGTDHDIPSYRECVRCHSLAQDDAINGFSAIQLAHEDGGLTLQALADEGWLSAPIAVADAQVPGDPIAQAALGYLHANCGSCHGGPEPEHGLDYWLRVGTGDVTSTTTWSTAVCACSVWTGTSAGGEVVDLRIAPGHPELSVSVLRMETRVATDAMPPIGSSVVDSEGLSVLTEWIALLDETSNGCPHGCPWP